MALPRMPELVFNYTFDNNDDDIAEDGQLIMIVKKLQTAKASLEQTKKRKRTKEIIANEYNSVIKDNGAAQQKFKKRWGSLRSQLEARVETIATSAANISKEIQDSSAACKRSLDSWMNEVSKLQAKFDDYSKVLADDMKKAGHRSQKDSDSVKQQIDGKMNELRVALMKIEKQSLKDDKLAAMLKSLTGTFKS